MEIPITNLRRFTMEIPIPVNGVCLVSSYDHFYQVSLLAHALTSKVV